MYRSVTTLTVDSARVARDYVKGLNTGERQEDPSSVLIQQVTVGLTKKSILMPVLEALKPYPDVSGVEPDKLMSRLRKSVVVTRPKEGVGIAISYSHSDPQVAQAVLALLVEQLQEEILKNREKIIENTTGFISGELERVKADLEAKEGTISEFKKAHLGELPQQLETNLRSLDRLQTDLTNMSDSLNKLGERLTAIEKTIKEYPDLGPVSHLQPLGKDRRSGDLRPIDSRIARIKELRQKLSELLATYKDSYPDVLYVKEELRRLEAMLPTDSVQLSPDEAADGKDDFQGLARKPTDPYLRELMKERSEIKSEMVFLKEKQAQASRQKREIEERVERTPTREQSLALLLRDYDNMQKNYQSLLDKRTSARLLGNYESQHFGEQYRVIEPANFPYEPEPPTQMQFLLGGLALGCLIGFGSAIGIDMMKTGFRRPEEVEHYLGISVIASIPSFSSAMNGVGAMQSRALLAGPGVPTDTPEDAPSYLGFRKKGANVKLGKGEPLKSAGGLSLKFHLIAKWGPASLMAEQYRVAATRLILMTAANKNVVTLVTSSVMGEGKTTTAINLAYILAHDLSKSTLLIDCDFKRPMVHQYMGIPAGPGLGDVLQGGEILENCLHRCDDMPLWILPSGSPGVRPAGLSGMQYVKKILPELKARYDHVILDGPPVMPLADVNILSGMTDMTAFVVRAGGTSQDVAKTALRALGDSADAAGIILTQVQMEYAPYFTYAAAYTNEDSRSRT